MHADDTVLMSESPNELQAQLDFFYEYCQYWKLTVNIEKTKVLVFSKGRLAHNLLFGYNGKELDIVTEFSYLGLYFSKTGNF
jgi:hypothetical protein